MNPKLIVRFLFGSLLIVVGVSQSGCEDLVQSGAEDAQYRADTSFYEGRGLNRSDAERNASEDQALNPLNQ